MNTKQISTLSLIFFAMLFMCAIAFRKERFVDCEGYQYKYKTTDTSGFIIVLPIPLDSCICKSI